MGDKESQTMLARLTAAWRVLPTTAAVRGTARAASSSQGKLDPTNNALFNRNERHVLAALVTNEPGCLAHIANTLSARGYNIDSLVVGRTEIPDLSRMTIVVEGSAKVMNQVQSQLEDLVPVVVTERL